MNYMDTPEGYGPPYIPFQASQGQDPDAREVGRSRQQTVASEGRVGKQTRMPKAQALVLLRHLKQGIVVGSLVCFGTAVGLIVNQTQQASAQQTTQSTTTTSTTSSQRTTTSSSSPGSTAASTGSSTASQGESATPTSTSTSNTSTSSSTAQQQQGGGYGFGSTQPGQSVSGSHTS